MYKNDNPKFCETATQWTKTYANEDGEAASPYQEVIDIIVDMGFDKAKVEKVVTEVEGDKDKAINVLLGGA